MRTTEKSIWLEGFRRAWKQLTSQLFPGPTESREPDGFFCWPRDQSVFVLLYHYMPTVNKIAIHKNRPINHNNGLSKTKRQPLTSL